MKDRDEYDEVEAELWIRSFAPVGGDDRQAAAIERLQELNEDDRLADLTVRMWGKAMRRSSPAAYTEEGAAVFDRVDEFAAWAAETGRSLEPYFEEHEEHCEFTGESDSIVVLPALALAEYRDGDLAHLAPHTDGDARVTVEGRIEDLVDGGLSEPERQPVAAE